MPKVPYPYEVNGKLVTGNGFLIPICSFSNCSLLPSLTALLLQIFLLLHSNCNWFIRASKCELWRSFETWSFHFPFNYKSLKPRRSNHSCCFFVCTSIVKFLGLQVFKISLFANLLRFAVWLIGLNQTSRPVPVVREFSNVRIPDSRTSGFFLSGLRTFNTFKIQEN